MSGHNSVIEIIEHGYLEIQEMKPVSSSKDRTNKILYYISKYYDWDLKKFVLSSFNLNIPDKLKLAIQLAKGVEAFHGMKINANGKPSIFHRDIKPSNILIEKDKNFFKIRIGDFGTAHLSGFFDSDFHDYTRAEIETYIQPTQIYASPEQKNNKQIDYRTDIYSLGKTFYYLFRGVNVDTDYVSIGDPRIDNVIKKMIREEPSQRYQSISGVIIDLDNILEYPEVGNESIIFGVNILFRSKVTRELVLKAKDLLLLNIENKNNIDPFGDALIFLDRFDSTNSSIDFAQLLDFPMPPNSQIRAQGNMGKDLDVILGFINLLDICETNRKAKLPNINEIVTYLQFDSIEGFKAKQDWLQCKQQVKAYRKSHSLQLNNIITDNPLYSIICEIVMHFFQVCPILEVTKIIKKDIFVVDYGEDTYLLKVFRKKDDFTMKNVLNVKHRNVLEIKHYIENIYTAHNDKDAYFITPEISGYTIKNLKFLEDYVSKNKDLCKNNLIDLLVDATLGFEYLISKKIKCAITPENIMITNDGKAVIAILESDRNVQETKDFSKIIYNVFVERTQEYSFSFLEKKKNKKDYKHFYKIIDCCIEILSKKMTWDDLRKKIKQLK